MAATLCVPLAHAASVGVPVAVSPTIAAGEAVVEARCPTFSWAGVEGAHGYELAVLAVRDGEDLGAAAAESPLVTRAKLSAGARSWTPTVGQCLERGGRYAWSVRAVVPSGESGWSQPAIFRVEAGPTMAEVEAAIETLRRDRERKSAASGQPSGARSADGTPPAPDTGRPAVRPAPGAGPSSGPGPRAVAGAVSLGSPSLSVSDNIALGAVSNLFKDGQVFLWDDAANLGLGRGALQLAGEGPGFIDTEGNTGIGRGALQNTVAGSSFWHGDQNTAVGDSSLSANTVGDTNTAIGSNTLGQNETGSFNTAIGAGALNDNVSGLRNTALGHRAGRVATGSDNIYVANEGTDTDSGKIRIGIEGTHNGTFIAGIDTPVSGNPVLLSEDGQLGVGVSSMRFKEQISELAEVGERLAALRPVTFRYRPELVAGGGELEVGLIAEEVAELFPALVTHDGEGRPQGVRYDLLSVLLLGALQDQERALERQERQLAALGERFLALERGEGPAPDRRPWWRRLGGGASSPQP